MIDRKLERRLKKHYRGIEIPEPGNAPEINWNETLVVIAVPQWGKTRLMQALAEPLKGNLIVVDTAQRGEWDRFGLPISEDWRDLGRVPGIVWRPNIDHVLEPDLKGFTDEWSRGLDLILNVRAPKPGPGGPVGGVTVILDEMLDSAPARLHPKLHRGAIQGQGRGLGLWGGGQSPYGISQRLLSAATHRFAGRIGTAQERGIVEASWGALPAVELAPPEPEKRGGEFIYVGSFGRVYGPFALGKEGEILPNGAKSADTPKAGKELRGEVRGELQGEPEPANTGPERG